MVNFHNSLVWFRRDLRLSDHAALHYALRQSKNVFCVFVFDKEILDDLPRKDRRVEFIHACLAELDLGLRKKGSRLIVLHGFARTAIPKLAAQLGIEAVFANHGYESSAIDRDNQISHPLKDEGRKFLTFKDQVIFEKNEVLSLSGNPFTVFTPYKKAWLKKLQSGPHDPIQHSYLSPYPIDDYAERFARIDEVSLLSLPLWTKSDLKKPT